MNQPKLLRHALQGQAALHGAEIGAMDTPLNTSLALHTQALPSAAATATGAAQD